MTRISATPEPGKVAVDVDNASDGDKVILVIIIVIISLVALLVGIGIGFLGRHHLKQRFIMVPANDAPGYTFTLDSVTYQVRPIKIRHVIYYDAKADSVYRSLLEISDK